MSAPHWSKCTSDGIHQARDLTAGQWTVALTQDTGSPPLLQILHPDNLPEPASGYLDEHTARHLAYALLRQCARATAGRILRKWTRKPRHPHATSLGHSHPAQLRGR